MPDSFTYLIPLPPAQVDRHFGSYRFTHEFYHEVQLRQEHAAYCEWYAQVAAQHRQEHERMQAESNPLRWFYGQKGAS